MEDESHLWPKRRRFNHSLRWVECKVIRLNDQVAVDIGPDERIVAIEVLDASELIPGIKERGVFFEDLAVASKG